jgi:REP element-mobilizing transposase RayT
MDLPERKALRLPEYDYSAPGAYFVTVCTQNRRCILSHITVGADALGGPNLTLTETGKVVEKYILSTSRIDGLHVDKYVIMPNHIHMILRIDGVFAEENGGPPRASAPTAATIPSAIGALKRLVHREAGRVVFQRSYHEHVIRNERDYLEIWNYIDTNPAKWAEDRYYQA